MAGAPGSSAPRTITNHSPLYKLLPHIERDLRTALLEHAGPGGLDVITLYDLGDFS